MTARPPATASGWRPRRGAGRRHPEAVDACGVVLLGSDPPPGRTASLSGGRRRVAAGRAACQRAARVLRSATALRVTHRPPRGSDGSYGPCGPAWTRASRPSTTSQGPGAPPNSERRTGPEPPARDWGRGRRVPGGGAGCAVSLCRRRVDVLTEPTGGPFSRGRRGPFFSCHFHMPSVLRGCVRAPPRAPRAGQGVRPPAAGAADRLVVSELSRLTSWAQEVLRSAASRDPSPRRRCCADTSRARPAWDDVDNHQRPPAPTGCT